MLILRRKQGEQIIIGEACLTVHEIRGNSVRLTLEAPKEIRIIRAELVSSVDWSQGNHCVSDTTEESVGNETGG